MVNTICLIFWRRPSDSPNFPLIYSYMGIYYGHATAATTADVFNAIAEPRRRRDY